MADPLAQPRTESERPARRTRPTAETAQARPPVQATRDARRDRATPGEAARAEAERVHAARSGDRDAFDALAVAAMPKLIGTATRLVGPGFPAEEMVAEALFRAFRHMHRFRGDSGFATWVHRILYRVVADRFRRRARDARRRDKLIQRSQAAGPQVPRTTLGRMADAERIRLLRRALADLPETQRLVLTLHVWEDLSLRDVAALLGLRYATTKSHLHHARRHLRLRFPEDA